MAGRIESTEGAVWSAYQSAIGDAADFIAALAQLSGTSSSSSEEEAAAEEVTDLESTPAPAAAALSVMPAAARALLADVSSDELASSDIVAAPALLAWAVAMCDAIDAATPTMSPEELAAAEGEALLIQYANEVSPPLPKLTIPIDLIATLVSNLRQSCIRELASKGVQRRGAVNAQCEDRKAKLTEQLEERLRQHWPRKGRIEVKAHQPRADELRKHQARYLRHVRKVRDVLRLQGLKLEELAKSACDHSAEYLSAVQVLDARIPRMSKLTALQGVLRKGMKARTDFAHEVEAVRATLDDPSVREPKQLLDDNALFLRGCHTFATGGDYDTGEIKIAQDKLAEVDGEIRDAIRERQRVVASVVKEQDEAVDAFEALETTYQRVKLELSMREGLGHKYGAPRRNVQERLRTETTKSSAAEAAIEANLAKLETLTATTLALPTAATESTMIAEIAEDEIKGLELDAGSEAAMAKNVIVIMTSVRRQFLSYAFYLEALKDETKVDTLLTAVPWWSDALQEEAASDETFIGDAEAALVGATALRELAAARRESDAAASAPSERTPEEISAIEMIEAQLTRIAPQFMKVAIEAEEQCRKDTKELYTKEGKLNLLGPDGVTEALKEYLQQMQKRGEEHRIGAHRQLRRQIDRMWRVLMETSSVVYRSIALFEQRRSVAACRKIRISFKVQYESLEAQKARHHTDLRPQLASASAAEVLATLLQNETDRWEKSKSLIRSTHAQLIEVEVSCGQAAETSVIDATKQLLDILDPLMTRQELRDLPNQVRGACASSSSSSSSFLLEYPELFGTLLTLFSEPFRTSLYLHAHTHTYTHNSLRFNKSAAR